MRCSTSLVLGAAALLLPFASARCSFAQKRSAVKAELDTIVSHSFADADKIPLWSGATRTFFVTPNELPETTLEVNVGLTADTVRDELVGLATALNAGVPPSSIRYINNRNGTLTSDFIQTDRMVLPRVNVREIHTFNSDCEITQIVGYVHGDVACPLNTKTLTNSVMRTLCTELEALGLVGTIQ